jgi:ArsR family transcriptional regulator
VPAARSTRTPRGRLDLLLPFADPIRIRILALLELEELSVGELARALGLAQSRVSNHLRLLRGAGLLEERRAGTNTFLRSALRPAAEEAGGAGVRSAPAGRLWAVLRDEFLEQRQASADRARLSAVLAARASDESTFFERLAADWDKLAGAFATGRARERAVARLLPGDWVLADLGCGTGYMAEALLGACTRLICVDRSARMLAEAEKRLARARSTTALEFRRGELDALPIADGELDGLVVGLVLHHLPALDPALREMRRVLAPGAAASVVELAPHRETWMRSALGDRQLGLEPEEVLAAFERAGFEDLLLDPLEDHYCPRPPGGAEPVALPLYLVRGRRPHSPGSS